MATIQNAFAPASTSGHLRPFDVRRDLGQVADLVEVCFNETMDPDGQRYLRQMRTAAHNPGFLHWANSVVEHTSMPLSGYVWEEDGKLVGNLSLIPFSVSGRRIYLIANVAVHPKYRRRGIARALTAAALDHAQKRRARSVWLHVREENEAAGNLYRSMGFQERARRTTWHTYPGFGKGQTGPLNSRLRAASAGYLVGPRRSEHWQQQQAWLKRLYPANLAWHFSLELSALQSGILGAVYRIFTAGSYNQWSVQKGGRLLGVVSRQRSSTYADYLWLAAPADYDEAALAALLVHSRQQLSSRRPLALDFPARLAENAIQAAGFRQHQILVWMNVSLPA